MAGVVSYALEVASAVAMKRLAIALALAIVFVLWGPEILDWILLSLGWID